MNHLAHFFLSGNNEDIAIGNFIADFISNKDLPSLKEGIKNGVMLHRQIDTFTDAHPLVKKGTKRLHPFHHKYAPVIVDIYYDYLLAKNWAQFAPPSVGMDDFTKKMYHILTKRCLDLPEKLQKRISYMIADNWLMKYTTFDGLEEAFARIEKAAAFPGNFGNAAEHLMEYIEEFDNEFLQFFPQLQNFVAEFLDMG